ncbi:acyltransferase family protein [Lacrimispora sp. 38-1]|uniref:acyltransferase family protein n=1 Tax=Lacrimispora sp. 38-1 TaxID=3125778 RepID=UPI003CF15359
MEKKRIAWMDITKAIGMMIVLVNHAELDFGVINYFGGMFYMPIFFMLSGMTFTYHKDEKLWSYAGKKAKRLLLPYLFYNLFLFLFFFFKNNVLTGRITVDSFFPIIGIIYSRNSMFSGERTNNIYFMQNLNAPTWFLTCMFLTLIFFWWLIHWSKDDQKKIGIINGGFLILAISLHYLSPVLIPWSLDSALYAVSFVLFGRFAQRKNLVGWLYQRPHFIIAVISAFVGLSYLNGSVNMSVGNYGKSMILYLVVGALGSVLCMELAYFIEKKSKILTLIGTVVGKKTIQILCLHLFVFMLVKVGAEQISYLKNAEILIKLLMVIFSLLILSCVEFGTIAFKFCVRYNTSRSYRDKY